MTTTKTKFKLDWFSSLICNSSLLCVLTRFWTIFIYVVLVQDISFPQLFALFVCFSGYVFCLSVFPETEYSTWLVPSIIYKLSVKLTLLKFSGKNARLPCTRSCSNPACATFLWQSQPISVSDCLVFFVLCFCCLFVFCFVFCFRKERLRTSYDTREHDYDQVLI